MADGVDDTADQRVTDGDGSQTTGAADQVSLFDLGVFAHDDDTDGVIIQVLGDTEHTCLGELDQFTGHDPLEAGNDGDAVTDFDDFADIDAAGGRLEVKDLLFEPVG